MQYVYKLTEIPRLRQPLKVMNCLGVFASIGFPVMVIILLQIQRIQSSFQGFLLLAGQPCMSPTTSFPPESKTLLTPEPDSDMEPLRRRSRSPIHLHRLPPQPATFPAPAHERPAAATQGLLWRARPDDGQLGQLESRRQGHVRPLADSALLHCLCDYEVSISFMPWDIFVTREQLI
jgi:hypothetical protein